MREKIWSIDLLPPRGHIIAEQLHHEVSRPLRDIVVLQEKSVVADLELSDVGTSKVFFEPQVFVKAP
jgi:hypothetical protein